MNRWQTWSYVWKRKHAQKKLNHLEAQGLELLDRMEAVIASLSEYAAEQKRETG